MQVLCLKNAFRKSQSSSKSFNHASTAHVINQQIFFHCYHSAIVNLITLLDHHLDPNYLSLVSHRHKCESGGAYVTVSVTVGILAVQIETGTTLTVGTVIVSVTGGRVGGVIVTGAAVGSVRVTVTVELVRVSFVP